MKHILPICLLLLSATCCAQGRDTFDVFFPLNDAKLSAAARDRIDMLVFKDSLVHGQQFIILGYTDYIGSNSYNEALSAKRATEVKNYLVTMGFTAKDISICAGKGKIDRTIPIAKDGMPPDRKVQIIIAPQPAPKPAAPAKTIVLDAAHLKVNAAVALNNIFFVGGTAIIMSTSMPELEYLCDFMCNNPTVKFQVEGHVCCKGVKPESDEEDVTAKTLSFDRAIAIYDYLASNGISKSRMTYRGFGTTRPAVYPAVSAYDQQQNRRVGIRITQK